MSKRKAGTVNSGPSNYDAREQGWRTLQPDDVAFWEEMRAIQLLWQVSRLRGIKMSRMYREHEEVVRSALLQYLQLSRQEHESLLAAEHSFSELAKFDLTLEKILGGWSTLVMQTEHGWDRTEYEWSNDFSSRDKIEVLLHTLPARKGRIIRIVEPWDERFALATVPVVQPVGGMIQDGRLLAKSEVRWWWFRYPEVLIARSPHVATTPPSFWDRNGEPVPEAAAAIREQWEQALVGKRV